MLLKSSSKFISMISQHHPCLLSINCSSRLWFRFLNTFSDKHLAANWDCIKTKPMGANSWCESSRTGRNFFFFFFNKNTHPFWDRNSHLFLHLYDYISYKDEKFYMKVNIGGVLTKTVPSYVLISFNKEVKT